MEFGGAHSARLLFARVTRPASDSRMFASLRLLHGGLDAGACEMPG